MPRANSSPQGRLRSWLTHRNRSSTASSDTKAITQKQAFVGDHTQTPSSTNLIVDDDFVANRHAFTREVSRDSIREVKEKIKTSIGRRMSALRRPRSMPEANCPEISKPLMPTNHARSADDALIADLDALSLSQPELEMLRRMEQVCDAARVARERRQKSHSFFAVTATREHQHPEYRFCDVKRPDFDLRLRGGGGGDENTPQPFGGRRRRTTLPCAEPSAPLDDSVRPNAGLWWLAGGKMSHKGRVPTIGELRLRKEVEQANRAMVGFWGTALGVRRIGPVGIFQDGGEGGEGGAIGEDGSVKSSRGDSGAAKDIDAMEVGIAENAGGSDKASSSGSKSVKSVSNEGFGVNEVTDEEKAGSIRFEGKESSVSKQDGSAEKAEGNTEAPVSSALPNANTENDKKDGEATADLDTGDAEGPGTRP